MGNQRFKLSDMVPNAWFYKLKDMSKPSKTTSAAYNKLKNRHRPPPEASPIPLLSPPEPEYQPRKSYHFSRDLNLNLPPTMEDPPLLLSPPRKSKSSTKSRKSKRTTTGGGGGGGGGGGCTCRATASLPSHRSKSPPSPVEHDHPDPGFLPDPVKNKPSHFDIVIDVNNYKLDPNSTQILKTLTTQSYKFNGIDFRLPKIITKPRNSNSNSNSIKEEKPVAPPSRRFSGGSPATGVRLKVNSPRIMARKSGGATTTATAAARRSVRKRRSISESFAVVKSSNDPQKDFRESMVEMIVQNNLRAPKDLEDLLACYLSLNSDEYHEVIIKVFKQIWFDLTELKHKKLVQSQQ